MVEVYDVLAALFWIAVIGGIIAYLVYFSRLPKEEREYRLQEARRRKEQKVSQKAGKGISKRDIIRYNKKNGIPMCPRCHSESITYLEKPGLTGVVMVDKNVGMTIPMGNNGYCKCLSCGKKWRI